jgi:hypothetical protein
LEEKLRDTQIQIEELKQRKKGAGGAVTAEEKWKGCWKGGHGDGNACG